MTEKIYQWTVVGAGPAGIAIIGKLLQMGVRGNEILWIDPYFNVGDLGRLWFNVSGNTNASLFIDFLAELAPNISKDYALFQKSPDKTCDLFYIVEPLKELSKQLCQQVTTEKNTILSLSKAHGAWQLTSDNEKIYHSQRVVIANGANPIRGIYPDKEIPLATALNKQKLAESIKKEDSVAVFGASHSAILILKYLNELGVSQIYNIYKGPCRYAHFIDEHILYDNTGLKGIAADWAKKYIDGEQPKNLIRIPYNAENNYPEITNVTHVISAIGFRPRLISSSQYDLSQYDPFTGIIAPGLYGLGIAYPEKINSVFGYSEYQVGLWKFMLYLKRILPLWEKYSA